MVIFYAKITYMTHQNAQKVVRNLANHANWFISLIYGLYQNSKIPDYKFTERT